MAARSTTTKRIMKEAKELASQPSSEYTASPIEGDIYEWHFTIRGPPAPSPYAGGIYHGRIVLPPAYPMKPPSFRFLTPTGRFEVNREICLSISGHHEETWQPAWGIRTALVAIRSFMDTDAAGQLGGMDASEEVRKRYARQSVAGKCAVCGKSNEDIMRAQDEAVRDAGGEGDKTEVPEELRLQYRENLSGENKEEEEEQKSRAETIQATTLTSAPVSTEASIQSEVRQRQPRIESTDETSSNASRSAPALPAQAARQRQAQPRQAEDIVPSWIDKAIYGILAVLAFLLYRRLVW